MRLLWEVQCRFWCWLLISDVRDGCETKQTKLWSHTLSSTTPEKKKKKNTRSLGSAFCSDILSFWVFLTSAWARMSAANGLRVQTRIRSPFALALDFFFFFFLQPHISFWNCSWSFSAWCRMSCPLLSVWVCSIINTEGGERMNKWRECMSFPLLSCPVLHLSFFFFFLHQASLSVCPSQFVCPHLHLHFCSLSCRPPHISVHPPPPPPPPPYHNDTVVGQGITEPD